MGLRTRVCTRVRACMHTRARVCTRVHARPLTFQHLRAHTCTRVHTCARTPTLAHTRPRTRVHTRARVCTHAPPRPQTPAHTRAHTCTRVHAHACLRFGRTACVCASLPARQPTATHVCAHTCRHVHTCACMLANHSHACHPILSPVHASLHSRSSRSHPYHASLIALFPLFSSRNCAFSPSAPPPRAPSQPRQFTLLRIPASLPLNPPAAYSATVRAAPRHRPPLTYFRCLPHTFLQEPSPYVTHPPNSSPCCCPSPSPVSLQLAPACPIPRLFVPPRKSSRTYPSPPDPVNRSTPHSDYPGPPPHLVTTRPAPTLTHVCACTRYTAVLFCFRNANEHRCHSPTNCTMCNNT